MVLIGLGSNQGDRIGFLSRAVHELEAHVNDVRISPVYESDAMLLPESPPSWDKPFLNVVISGKTRLTPHELLKHAKHIELLLGRPKNHPAWSPRTIDVDILQYGSERLDQHALKLPHPGMADRAFVVYPLDALQKNMRISDKKSLPALSLMQLKKRFSGKGGAIDDFNSTSLPLRLR